MTSILLLTIQMPLIHLIHHFYFEGSKQEVEGKILTAMRVGGTTGSSALVGTAAAS